MSDQETMSTEAIVEAFGEAGNVLPRAALQQATSRWHEVGPVFLELLRNVAACDDLAQGTSDVLFFAIFLMAQQRETRAYRPLCAICAKGELIERLIGEGVTENLSGILVRVYDGDPQPLRALIEDPAADQFVRAGGLEALAWLTAIGSIDRAETTSFLRELFTPLKSEAGSFVWVGWVDAVARLGLGELAPLAEEALERGWVDGTIMGPEHFREPLALARQSSNPTAAFEGSILELDRYDDVAAMLSEWHSFRPKAETRAPEMFQDPWDVPAPVRNPWRHVGRNDPCPCRSGKKFKKCCLGKMEA